MEWAEGRPSVRRYIQDLVVPYLCRAQEVAQGNWTEGYDRPHDNEGIYRELMSERLDIPKERVETILEQMYGEGGIEDSERCPCGSGLSFGSCHRTTLKRYWERYRVGRVPRDWPENWPNSWIMGKEWVAEQGTSEKTSTDIAEKGSEHGES